MKLCIPTLNQYERLNRLLQSAEDGALKPEAYVIIDNGGGYELPREFTDRRVEIVRPGRNLGVAASWNYFLNVGLEDDRPIAISNDDIVMHTDTFEELAASLRHHPFVGDGWAFFGQTPECTRRVGFYDENFWPGYYEDTDYDLRLRLAGIEPLRGGATARVEHVAWATTLALGNPSWMQEARDRNYNYFLTKWGSDNPRWSSWANATLTHTAPFNGESPSGWSERIQVRDAVAPMRWDVLNYVAQQIGALRYLEIGVSDGACMKKIEVREKWGVDPSPKLSGVEASTVFVPHTSDYFFEHIAPHVGEFDLVFIDGDHCAEQVYKEAKNALRFLSKKGFVCFHDCNPHAEEMQEVPHRGGLWTGDVWKAIVRLRAEGENLRVIPADFGIGVLVPSARSEIQSKMALACEWDQLTYKDLTADRAHLLGLIRPGGRRQWISKHF